MKRKENEISIKILELLGKITENPAKSMLIFTIMENDDVGMLHYGRQTAPEVLAAALSANKELFREIKEIVFAVEKAMYKLH